MVWQLVFMAFAIGLSSKASASMSLKPLTELAINDELAFLVQYSFLRKSDAADMPSDPNELASILRLALSDSETKLENASSISVLDLTKTFRSLHQKTHLLSKLETNEQTAPQLAKLRANLYKIGEWIYLRDNREDVREEIKFSYLALGIDNPNFSKASIKELLSLRKKAPKSMRSSLILLGYYHLCSSTKTLKKANDYIRKFFSQLEPYDRLIAALIRGQVEKGIIGGKLEAKAIGDFQKLLSISKNAQSIKETGIKQKINSTILFTWLTTTKKPLWLQAPIASVDAGFNQLDIKFRERIALNQLEENSPALALKIYTELAREASDQDLVVESIFRKLEILQNYARSSSNIQSLAKHYDRLLSDFGEPNPRLVETRRFEMLEGLHLSLLEYSQKILDRGKKEVSFYPAAESIVAVYLKHVQKDPASTKPLRAQLAAIYLSAKRYPQVLELYEKLSEEDPMSFIPKLIEAQAGISDWTLELGLVDRPKAFMSERKKLKVLIENYSLILGDQGLELPWPYSVELGLLYRHFDQKNRAEELWTQGLSLTKDHPELAAKSLAFMINEKQLEKDWDRLIQLVELAKKNKVAADAKTQSFIDQNYIKALIARSDLLSESNKTAEAREDLIKTKGLISEPSTRIAVTKRLIELQLKIKAFDSLKALLAELKSSSPSEDLYIFLLLNTANTLAGVNPKYAEVAIELYQEYLNDYPSHAGYSKVRWKLADTAFRLNKRELAAELLLKHTQDLDVSAQQRAQASLFYINIKKGSIGLVQAISTVENSLLNIDRSQPDAFISAQSYLALLAVDRSDDDLLAAYEAVLSPYAEERLDAASSLSTIAKYRADQFAKNMNINATDSKAYVEQVEKNFLTVSRKYESACFALAKDYCRNVYLICTDTADAAIRAIMSINSTNDAAFEALRSAAIERLQDKKTSYLEKIREYTNQNIQNVSGS